MPCSGMVVDVFLVVVALVVVPTVDCVARVASRARYDLI